MSDQPDIEVARGLPAGRLGALMTASDPSAADPYRVNSLILAPESDPLAAEVRWDPARSLWNGGMMVAALVLGPLTFAWDAFLVFLAISVFVLCTGHSVGITPGRPIPAGASSSFCNGSAWPGTSRPPRPCRRVRA